MLGPFTWRGDKILEGETTFRLVYMQNFRTEWLPHGEEKQEELVGGYLHGARILITLGSSYPLARKILVFKC